jgi:crotonobetainyl-CoA:carnitine CoA-transferase CaiB-like acyl-CoA transferase
MREDGARPGKGALDGVRVLDLSRVLAAPVAGMTLGDLGADVIKVERPGAGDDARHFGGNLRTPDGQETGGAMYLFANRNKRSITVDFALPEGAEIVRKLAAKADILIENFLPGTLARSGLDYAALRALNPRLIYCSLTGYGQYGPQSDRPGYDAVFQAQGGLMAVTGIADGEPGAGPMKTGPSMVDFTTGLVAVSAILAALFERERSGLGQFIDTALLDTVIPVQSSTAQAYLITREQPERTGTTGNGGQPARVFACADGPIYISAGNQRHYERLCKVLDAQFLLDHPLFATPVLRFRNRKTWAQIAEPIIAKWHRADLLTALVEAKVPVSAVNDYADVFADPQVLARGIVVPMENPLDPTRHIDSIASPIRLSRTPVSYRRRPPNLGEHTAQILHDDLGLDDAAVMALQKSGALGK